MATDLINIDIETTEVFAPGGADGLLVKIQDFVSSLDRDGSTVTGRDNIRSVARKIASTKNAIDKRGKEVKDEWKKKCDAIDAERRKIWDGLEKLHDEYRSPLTEFENAEKARVEKHEKKIEFIRNQIISSGSSVELQAVIDNIRAQYDGVDFEDFQKIADEAYTKVMATLSERLDATLKSEEDARELEALRKERAEKEAKEREESLIRDAEERTRRDMEAKAAKERADLEERTRKAEEAAQRATQAERDRIEADKKREADEIARREADINHKKEINNQAADDIDKIINEWTSNSEVEDAGKAIVRAIALGQIRNVKINY